MQITAWVPYDETRIRRTVAAVIRPQLRPAQSMGGVLVALGLLLALGRAHLFYVVLLIAAGVAIITLVGPVNVRRIVRNQSRFAMDGHQLTLTDEWLATTYPLAESRFRWAAVEKVMNTQGAWLLLLGKMQPFTIPKDALTEAQQAELAAFLAVVQQRQADREFLR